MGRQRGIRWTLILGLTIIGAVFIGAAVVGTFAIASTVGRSRALQERAINSLELVSRIVRDLDQERILVDDHIHESRPAAMVGMEKQLADVASDLRRAEQAYEVLPKVPAEAELWRRSQGLIARYHDATAGTLELSRRNLDTAARGRMLEVRSDYAMLDRQLFELIHINHDGVFEATKRIDEMQRTTDRILWGARLGAPLGLVLLGWWMVRRVGAYERQITGHARGLEERNRDLDAFAGRVAHDLKNALGPMGLAPSLLRRAPANPARVLETADRIERSSQRATAVVDSLLAFSRASQSVEADESASLRAVLQDVLETLGPRAAQLEVSVDASDVPDVHLRCNPGLLEIVLANLCGNAVKYLEGQEQRRVRVRARAEGSTCRIDVEDTGPGVPVEARGKIFEPFFRVKGTLAPGTGIGLATVRRIVEARAGRVTVEPADGRGSRFSVWLPLAEAPDDQPPRTEPELGAALHH